MKVDWPRARLSAAADAGEDPVDDRQRRFARGHERPGLGHQHDEGGLPQIRRLAAHVGSGQDHHLVIGVVQPDVVRHERLGPALDDRMPGIGDHHVAVVLHARFDVVAPRRYLGQRRQNIHAGQRPRAALDPLRLRENRAPQLVEDFLFPE